MAVRKCSDTPLTEFFSPAGKATFSRGFAQLRDRQVLTNLDVE